MGAEHEFEPVERLDAHKVSELMAAGGGPHVEIVGPMPGGAVRAFLVRRDDGDRQFRDIG
ncbi:MAG: hypothetical protein M5T61_07070 [Acidimicrobiia bacterium]|nr:hypothetical protein [Acidimicrobiia bacterium]